MLAGGLFTEDILIYHGYVNDNYYNNDLILAHFWGHEILISK